MESTPLHESLTGAKLIGIKSGVGDSTIFGAWFGGVGFNCYDSNGYEVNHFNSGELTAAEGSDNRRRLARDRLESAGFEVLE